MQLLNLSALFLACAASLISGLPTQDKQAASLAKDVGLAALPANGWAKDLLNRVNIRRLRRGSERMCINNKLMAAAQIHTQDMAQYGFIDTIGSDGRDFKRMANRQGFEMLGGAINVAAGYYEVDSVLDTWLNPKGGNSFLFEDFKFMGVAFTYRYESKYKVYWTVIVGNSLTDKCDEF